MALKKVFKIKMQAFAKKNILTIIILGTTLILAGVGIFTAIRLYQLRNQAVAPNVPSSKPKAYSEACTVRFSLTAGSPTGSPTSSPTESPTGSPTATPSSTPTATPIGCNETCTSNSDCTGSMVCSGGRCRNASCTGESDCSCTTPTPTATATPGGGTTTTTTQPSLPDAGISTPTIIGGFAGILLLIGAFLLAL